MNALLTYLQLKLRQFANKVSDVFHVFLELISWPTWYFIVMIIMFLFMSVSLIEFKSWWGIIGVFYLILGFVVAGLKRQR